MDDKHQRQQAFESDNIPEPPIDSMKPLRFGAVFLSLYVMQFILGNLNPFFGALMVVLMTGILEGKHWRSVQSDYYKDNPTPVYVKIEGISFNDKQWTNDYYLPWRFYTTDVHRIIPNQLVDVYFMVLNLTQTRGYKLVYGVKDE